uniref:alpha-1,6-mannosyl-glycoprotein 6-beta-N-acetylglucosaminyltransferase n=1 Tax=Xenopus tropicalis TaxID=8364 RepID=A0A6I8QGJ3_XENTR
RDGDYGFSYTDIIIERQALWLPSSKNALLVSVLGTGESRGALRRMNDILETLVRRMDMLARLENASEYRRGEEAEHYGLDGSSVGLMEKIQAIAQNVSDIAVKVDQILRNSLLRSKGQYGQGARFRCSVIGSHGWMPKTGVSAARGNMGLNSLKSYRCIFFVSLVVEGQRDLHDKHQPLFLFPQAAFRTELSSLLDSMGTGKESLIFMKKRLHRLEAQWLLAARRLENNILDTLKEQKQILVHIVFLMKEQGDIFSPRVLKDGPLGEMVQWADILVALYVLGHILAVGASESTSTDPRGTTELPHRPNITLGEQHKRHKNSTRCQIRAVIGC